MTQRRNERKVKNVLSSLGIQYPVNDDSPKFWIYRGVVNAVYNPKSKIGDYFCGTNQKDFERGFNLARMEQES